jgi:type I restriction enzyme M protein
MKESFPKGKYADVLGLCKVATLDEIEAQGWSLNPGRYVGVAERAADDFELPCVWKNSTRSWRH